MISTLSTCSADLFIEGILYKFYQFGHIDEVWFMNEKQ